MTETTTQTTTTQTTTTETTAEETPAPPTEELGGWRDRGVTDRARRR